MISEIFKEEYPNFRSDEEVFFQWYIDDLIEAGFIEKFNYEQETYTIFDQLKLPWMKQMKTKVAQKEFEAIKPSTYTPDFNIYWTDEAKGIFINGIPSEKMPYFAGAEFLDLTDQGRSVLDVKGADNTFGKKNSSIYTFPLKQRMMWLVHNIYVQKVVPQQLFQKTFTPYRYTLTNQSGKKRKLQWESMNVYEYVEMMKKSHINRNTDPQVNLF